jgi:hypothetical protein
MMIAADVAKGDGLQQSTKKMRMSGHSTGSSGFVARFLASATGTYMGNRMRPRA